MTTKRSMKQPRVMPPEWFEKINQEMASLASSPRPAKGATAAPAPEKTPVKRKPMLTASGERVGRLALWS